MFTTRTLTTTSTQFSNACGSLIRNQCTFECFLFACLFEVFKCSVYVTFKMWFCQRLFNYQLSVFWRLFY